MDDPKFEIEERFLELIKTPSDDIKEAVGDIATDLVDSVPFLPIVSISKRLFGGISAVRDYFFAKKVCKYIEQLDGVTAEERVNRIEELDSTNELERFVENTCLILDQLNDSSKATLMGRAARAYFRGSIDFSQLLSLNHAIDAIEVSLIRILKDVRGSRFNLSEDLQRLVNCGLLFQEAIGMTKEEIRLSTMLKRAGINSHGVSSTKGIVGT
jgi:hypothetical protein